jgi:hypothetical protein
MPETWIVSLVLSTLRQDQSHRDNRLLVGHARADCALREEPLALAIFVVGSFRMNRAASAQCPRARSVRVRGSMVVFVNRHGPPAFRT